MTTPKEQAELQAGQGFRMAQHIGTRDGTLAKDGKQVNLLTEMTPEGETVVKRPGLDFVHGTVAGDGRGFLSSAYAIVGFNVYEIAGVNPPLGLFPGPYGNTSDMPRILPNVPTGSIFTPLVTLIQSASGLWNFSNIFTAIGRVTDLDFPPNLAVSPQNLQPSLCELDGTYYVQTTGGVIYGSDFQNYTSWNPLNTIAPSFALGFGRGMIRHLNYIVAFYQRGIQFYYDAANPPPGSPLLPVQNAAWTVGCFVGTSIVELNDITYFIGIDTTDSRAVYCIRGLQLELISNPAISRILEKAVLPASGFSAATVNAYGLKVSGHFLYVIQIRTTGVTLVYDETAGDWSIFTSVVGGVEGEFKGFTCVQDSFGTYLQNPTTGNVYKLNEASYQDSTGPINCLTRTSNLDWGNSKLKRFAGMYLHADTIAASVAVRYSDDDYTTYSSYRNIDLSTVRKMLQRCGSSRKRSWDFLHTANTPYRAQRVSFDMNISGL